MFPWQQRMRMRTLCLQLAEGNFLWILSGASPFSISVPAVWMEAACSLVQVLHRWTFWLCAITVVLLFVQSRHFNIWTFTGSNNVTGVKQHVGFQGPGIMGSALCYPSGINWCTGALGQTSVIYAIVKTFTPICSTVYHVLSDKDRLQCTLSIPSPLSASLVQ